jgi:hypothetical protein
MKPEFENGTIKEFGGIDHLPDDIIALKNLR